MLEKLPHAVGEALRGIHPGLKKTIYYDKDFAGLPETLELVSPTFSDDSVIPQRYTFDGKKISPPLAWRHVPELTRGLVLIIEDADSPTPAPIVHAMVLDLPSSDGELYEASLKSPGAEGDAYTMGDNTLQKPAYLPPDPPPGGGIHRYVFQLYALDRPIGLHRGAGRKAVKKAMKDHVLAKGKLIGTYQRL